MKRFFLRLYFDNAMVGPGKAELLEHIRETGSISAAGRAMGMSYKRAWMLVEELNAAFSGPLVASARGGPGGGGAHLTPEGDQVLALFREIERKAREAGADEIAALEAMLAPAAISDMAVRK
ncbi:winged helix-turn-helix domain-containing protein [Pseudogemmobacter bohemicus]|uniref:winged helix-turn-helix domain-containing protein n=1 Tax=Pseudogemmobacter bohemicus TaxID=2250708 RepID=UPI001E5E32C2|nr:LysR family transcriptional regulator [Pseudogemmobacter bohemicus]